MARFLVTGGAGFIGSHLVDALSKKGHDVRILDDFSSGSMENLEDAQERYANAIEIIKGSITEPDLVDSAVKGIDAIFHEAALVSVSESMKNPKKTRAINVEGTRNVLESAKENKVKNVILASSAAVYGDNPPPLIETMPVKPLSPYASSKCELENLARCYWQDFGIRTISLRYFNVYGPRQDTKSEYSGVIARFMDCLKQGKQLTIYGDGKQTRDFIYVEDVIRANLLALDSDIPGGRTYNIATGKGITLLELLKIMQKLYPTKIEPIHKPARAGDIRHSYANIKKARSELGFEPGVRLESGLKELGKWMGFE